jgi:flagellar hook-length control protein FliK
MTVLVAQSLPSAPDFSSAVMSKTGASGTASLFDALVAALDAVNEKQPTSGSDAQTPSQSFPWPTANTGDAPRPTPVDDDIPVSGDDTASLVDVLPPNFDGSVPLPLPLPPQSEIAQPVPEKSANIAGLDAPPVKNSVLCVLAANAYAEAAALNESEIPEVAHAAGAATPHIPAIAQTQDDSKVVKAADQPAMPQIPAVADTQDDSEVIKTANQPAMPQLPALADTQGGSRAIKAANETSVLQAPQPVATDNESARPPAATPAVAVAAAAAVSNTPAPAPAPRSEEPDDSADPDDVPNPNATADDVAKTVANTAANPPTLAPQPIVAAILAVTEAQPLVAGTFVTASTNPSPATVKPSMPQANGAILSDGDARGTNAARQTTQNASEKIVAVDQHKTQEAAHTPAPPPRPENEPVATAANAEPQTPVAPQPHHASTDTAPPASSISAIAAPNAPPTERAIHFEVTAPANAAADMGALALRIAAKSSAGESEFTVQLDPPDLGRIEVRLNVNSQGSAQANLIADKPQTLDLLQRDAPFLERAIKDAGLDLAGGLSFSLKSDGQPGDWRNPSSSGQGRAPRIEMVDGAGAHTASIPSASLIAADWAAGTMRLDIRI